MTNRHSRRSALLLAAAWPLPAAAFDLGRLFGEKGSGRVIHHEAEFGEFDALEIGGDLQVVVLQAQPPRLIIDTDDNLVPLIVAELKGRTLRLRQKAALAPTRLAITVNAWILQRVEVSGSAALSLPRFVSKQLRADASGSAHIAFDALTTETLEVHLAGAARMTIAGRANDFSAAVAGSGVLAASAFEARRVSVNLAGAGVADVWAVDTLSGAAAGAANLRYRGDPRVGVARAGAANVARKS